MADILELQIARSAGDVMVAIQEAHMIVGRGIVLDRYAEGTGHFQVTGSEHRRSALRDVSIISAGAIDLANQDNPDFWNFVDTRRNVLTDVDPEELNSWVDKDFWLGGVAFRGVELCTPCTWPSQISGKPGFREAFKEQGGLRARVLNSGIVAVGMFVSSPRS